MRAHSLVSLAFALTLLVGCSGDPTSNPPSPPPPPPPPPGPPPPPPPPPPAPPIVFPLTVGKRWLYDDTSHSTVCSGSGCSTAVFSGRSVVVVDSQLTLLGVPAARLRQFRIGHNGDFRVSTLYLGQRSSGLSKYSTSGGVWQNVLSTTSGSVSNGAFVLAGGPHHADAHLLSTGSLTVPAGSYSVLWTKHHFTETGQFVTADIFEDEAESFADNVGLVSALQDYTYDDNDPQGIDTYYYGLNRLMAVDAFSPLSVPEAEANDTGTTALPALADSVIVTGNTLMTDAGAIVAGTVINPDTLGFRRVQDWYRFVAPRTGTLVVKLIAEQSSDDLDLYVLQFLRAYTVAGSSTNPAGQAETVQLAVTAGTTYYIAIQAWNTGFGGRTNYWLYVR